jgi:hypothetical protein
LNGTAEPAAPAHGALGLLEQVAARAALRGLPGRQREAIVLRYDAGLPEGQIAAACAVPSVGFVWGPAAASRACGVSVGLEEALTRRWRT